ncbi:hypothetical protein EVAR_90062_1 [Eumeta japonica]|uniref:Transposase Tc1-like domain-containing protein n=1 Tax=Eumeta variegata TaxID=151549 RepID=A0A4C1WXD9_EUMVA|nr:hypothetical protein EVAR_90062_1 [Eumeta japonica]
MCEGRPTATTEDISAVRLTIDTDERVTCQQIWTSLGIGMSQVHKVLHKHLAVRKLYARRIPQNLTEAEKLRRVNWCRKIMQRNTDFLWKTGHYVTTILEDKKTVSADLYTNNCLPFVSEKVREKRPLSGILILNISPRTVRRTTNYLGTLGLETLVHPPFYLDLER